MPAAAWVNGVTGLGLSLDFWAPRQQRSAAARPNLPPPPPRSIPIRPLRSLCPRASAAPAPTLPAMMTTAGVAAGPSALHVSRAPPARAASRVVCCAAPARGESAKRVSPMKGLVLSAAAVAAMWAPLAAHADIGDILPRFGSGVRREVSLRGNERSVLNFLLKELGADPHRPVGRVELERLGASLQCLLVIVEKENVEPAGPY